MLNQDGLMNRELVSALADGQLLGAEFASVVKLSSSQDALAAWHAYHVIGDTLRCAELAACADDQAFVVRLRGRMASVHQPLLRATPSVELPALLPHPAGSQDRQVPPYAESANESAGRWKLLAGLASLAAVFAIGWNLAGSYGSSGEQARLAAASGAAVGVAVPLAQAALPGNASSGPQVMLRDARLDELLAAHKQFGGTSALQMPAGFLRNATFENSGR